MEAYHTGIVYNKYYELLHSHPLSVFVIKNLKKKLSFPTHIKKLI